MPPFAVRAALLALLALPSTGCGVGADRGASRLSEQACSTTADGYTVCEPSAPLPPGATPPPPPIIVTASNEALAGVPLGEAADDAVELLTAVLGEPRVEAQPCLRPERRDTLDQPRPGRRLSWPSLTAFLTDTPSGGAVLTGWAATAPPQQPWRYDVRLPYGVRLQQPVEEVMRLLPGARSSVAQEGPDAGFLVITSPDEPAFAVTSTDGEDGVVHGAAYDAEGCR